MLLRGTSRAKDQTNGRVPTQSPQNPCKPQNPKAPEIQQYRKDSKADCRFSGTPPYEGTVPILINGPDGAKQLKILGPACENFIWV